MNNLQCDVVIVGSGPVGMSLALQLADEGVDTIVLERHHEILREPRAVGIDGESLRAWQAVGLVDQLMPFIHFKLGGRYFNAQGQELFWLNYEGQEPCGYPMKQSFEQGETDYVLACAVKGHDHARHFFNHTVTGLKQDESGVRVSVIDDSGEPLEIESKFIVGCDGANSTVRDALNIQMSGDDNEFPWLVIDTHDEGFTSGPVSAFFCDPKRPGMTLRISPTMRRWEWMLLPGETPEDLLEERMIRSLIAPFTDAEKVQIFRKRVYNFSAVIADRWQDSHALLAGDAAHMTPPFAGQGLNAGIRDTRNLFWKMALVVQEKAEAALLETYETERREHTRELLEFAVKLGEQIQPLDAALAEERDSKFAELRKDPKALKAYVEELTKPQANRSLAEGAVVSPGRHPLNGQYVPQPRLTFPDRSEQLLDEILGPGFSILGFECDPADEIPASALERWEAIGCRTAAIANASGSSKWPHDASGKMDALFRSEPGTMALIRPDRFIVSAFSAHDAADGLAAAEKALLLRD
jgi:3-(3-hydroxy-phenyl)propionate hydroxylase